MIYYFVPIRVCNNIDVLIKASTLSNKVTLCGKIAKTH